MLIRIANAQIVTDTPNSFSELEKVFGSIVGFVIPFASIILFVYLVFGGIKYITAGSDPGKVESARKTITYAIIGLLIIASAFLILRIIALFTGQPGLLEFRI